MSTFLYISTTNVWEQAIIKKLIRSGHCNVLWKRFSIIWAYFPYLSVGFELQQHLVLCTDRYTKVPPQSPNPQWFLLVEWGVKLLQRGDCTCANMTFQVCICWVIRSWRLFSLLMIRTLHHYSTVDPCFFKISRATAQFDQCGPYPLHHWMKLFQAQWTPLYSFHNIFLSWSLQSGICRTLLSMTQVSQETAGEWENPEVASSCSVKGKARIRSWPSLLRQLQWEPWDQYVLRCRLLQAFLAIVPIMVKGWFSLTKLKSL